MEHVRSYRFALRPSWFLLHLFTLAAIVTMVLLGRWQLTVSQQKHFNVRNFGYALQWWVFCVFFALMWGRILRDHARRSRAPLPQLEDATVAHPDEPVAYRRYVAPATPMPAADDDPVYAAYNDYLARLDAEH